MWGVTNGISNANHEVVFCCIACHRIIDSELGRTLRDC
jgi:hypothetical protein